MAGVERLRERRLRPPGDASLTPQMGEWLREIRKLQRGLSGVAAAWASVVPAHLAERTVIEGINRGTLTVRVPDSATRFNLDRFLRAGGERAIAQASATPVRTVRLVIGARSD